MFIFCPVILWNFTACLSTAVNPFIKLVIITEGSVRVLKAFVNADFIPTPNTDNLLTEPSARMVSSANSSMSSTTSLSLKALAKLPPISLRPFRIPPETPMDLFTSLRTFNSSWAWVAILSIAFSLSYLADKIAFSSSEIPSRRLI